MPGHRLPVGQVSPSGSCARLRVVFSLRFPSASLSGASELIVREARVGREWHWGSVKLEGAARRMSQKEMQELLQGEESWGRRCLGSVGA